VKLASIALEKETFSQRQYARPMLTPSTNGNIIPPSENRSRHWLSTGETRADDMRLPDPEEVTAHL